MNVPGSANSVLVKCRAMYSDRLTSADYANLLNSENTVQIAEYLKSKSCYARALTGFSASAPYEGQLHGLLRSRLFEQTAVLGRYENSIGKSFYRYFSYKNDCMQILLRLRTLSEGAQARYISALDFSHDKFSYLDLVALAGATSLDAVRAVLEGTEYKNLLNKPDDIILGTNGLIALEEEMHSFCCEKLLQLIGKDSVGKKRRELIKTVAYCKDIETLVNIYRLKRFRLDSEGFYRRIFVEGLTLLTPKQRRAVIMAQDHNEVAALAGETLYAPLFSGQDLEATAHKLTVDYCKKRFGFTADSAEAIWCYMTLREYEINDIMNIFEGVRCRMSPEHIKQYIYCVSL